MADRPLPGHSEQPEDIHCPSCGRFTGAASRCPHCGSQIQKRLSIKATRYAAVLLSTVGLFLLYMMATRQKIPTVSIADIEPGMNFAYVNISGTVAGSPRIFEQDGIVKSMSFDVSDGTHVIPVRAYRKQAQTMVDRDLIPHSGDHIEVAGNLAVAADEQVQLRLQVVDHMKLERTEAKTTLIADTDQLGKGSTVLVKGTIIAVSAPKPASKSPWRIVLQDESESSIPVTFWSNIYDSMTDKPLLVVGTEATVRGTISVYRDQRQIKLENSRDLTLLQNKITNPTMQTTAQSKSTKPSHKTEDAILLEEMTTDMKGREIETEGSIVSYWKPDEGSKRPAKLMIEDGNCKRPVVFWSSVADELDPNTTQTGARVLVRGIVDVYKDTPQIKVKYADQIQIISPAIPKAEKPVSMAISKITPDMDGQQATVYGRLGAPAAIRGGVTYPLRDKTGTIILLLWDKDIPGDDRARLMEGTYLYVTGSIKLYKDALEIIPKTVQDIRLIERGMKHDSDAGETTP